MCVYEHVRITLNVWCMCVSIVFKCVYVVLYFFCCAFKCAVCINGSCVVCTVCGCVVCCPCVSCVCGCMYLSVCLCALCAPTVSRIGHRV